MPKIGKIGRGVVFRFQGFVGAHRSGAASAVNRAFHPAIVDFNLGAYTHLAGSGAVVALFVQVDAAPSAIHVAFLARNPIDTDNDIGSVNWFSIDHCVTNEDIGLFAHMAVLAAAVDRSQHFGIASDGNIRVLHEGKILEILSSPALTCAEHDAVAVGAVGLHTNDGIACDED